MSLPNFYCFCCGFTIVPPAWLAKFGAGQADDVLCPDCQENKGGFCCDQRIDVSQLQPRPEG